MAKQVQTPAQIEALAAVGQRATCQVCGRQQKITKRGVIANHGYTVGDGWHMGTCFGSGWLPREVSIDCINLAVSRYEEVIAKDEAEIADCEAGTRWFVKERYENRFSRGWILEPTAGGYTHHYETRNTDAATVERRYRAERVEACEKRIATCKQQIKMLGELTSSWTYVGLKPNA